MATITSAASGNWSNTATWVGGVVPTAADDVVVNHNITADVDITVLTITINNVTLTVSTSRNITCTAANGITAAIVNTDAGAVAITANAASTINITSNIRLSAFGGGFGSSRCAVVISGQAVVNVIGNLLNNISSGDVIIGNGNVIIINTNAGRLNVTGNLIGSSNLTNGKVAVYSAGTGTIVNITGNCTAQGGSALISNGHTGTITINGTTTASSTTPALQTSTTELVIGGSIVNTAGRSAVFGQVVRIASATNTQWLYQTNNALVTKTLYDINTLPTVPIVSDVRSGVSYASGALTGTLIVPPANAVTAGVTYDNGTVGTAQNTAASFLTELAASSDPLAVRLKNVATVQTTGDQIAAAL